MGRVAGGQYTEEEIERALVALALNAGNASKAVDQLEAQGFKRVPNMGTLNQWRVKYHPERYQQISKRVQAEVAELIAQETEELIVTQAEAEREATKQVLEALREGQISPRELPGALRNISTSKAINVDKWSGIRGRPMVHVQHHSADELLAQLERQNPGYVDSSAEPIEDAKQISA